MATGERTPTYIRNPDNLRTITVVEELPSADKIRASVRAANQRTVRQFGTLIAGTLTLLGAYTFAQDQSAENNSPRQYENLQRMPILDTAESPNQITSAPDSEIAPNSNQINLLPNAKLSKIDSTSFPGIEIPASWYPSDSEKARFIKEKGVLEVEIYKQPDPGNNRQFWKASAWTTDDPIPVKAGHSYFLQFTAKTSTPELKPVIGIIPLDENGKQIGIGFNEYDFSKYSGNSEIKVFPITFPERTQSALIRLSAFDTSPEAREGLRMQFGNIAFIKSNPTRP